MARDPDRLEREAIDEFIERGRLLNPLVPFEGEPGVGQPGPRQAFQGPVPGINIPVPPVAIPPFSGAPPAPAPGLLARFGLAGAIGAVAVELLKRIGDELLERESAEMQREFEEEIRIIRRQFERARGTPLRTIEDRPPLRRAPQPVFTPARPQRVEEPPLIAEPLPEVQPQPVIPTQVPAPVVTPAPVEIPAPALPAPQPTQPAPVTRPGTRPGTVTRPATRPRTVPAPTTRPFFVGFPLPLPSVRVSPRPATRPRVDPDLRPLFDTAPRDLTQPRPTTVPSPRTQPRPSQCPPCPPTRRRRKDEEEEEPRLTCFKKLVKEARFASQDESFNWVEIDCETGREL